MRFLQIILALVVAASAVGAYAAPKPAVDRPISLFSGDDPGQDGIQLGSWGGGGATVSKERLLEGSWSIKITTQGLYSGARLDFARPVALFSGGIDNSRYVQFAFFFDDKKQVNPAAGTNYWWDIEPYWVPTVNKVRFVFVSDNDVSVAVERPSGKLDPDDNWVRIAVPLAKFKVNDDITDFRLKRLTITSDVPATMYLGEVELVTDDKPISVDELGEQGLAITDEVMWVPEAEGGLSTLKYCWDFDDKNGIQCESTDMIGRHVYKVGGEYTITLTVRDADGIKAPVTVKTKADISG